MKVVIPRPGPNGELLPGVGKVFFLTNYHHLKNKNLIGFIILILSFSMYISGVSRIC